MDAISACKIAHDGYRQPDRYEAIRWIQVVFARLVHDPHVPLAAGHTIRQDLVHLARFQILGPACPNAQRESRWSFHSLHCSVQESFDLQSLPSDAVRLIPVHFSPPRGTRHDANRRNPFQFAPRRPPYRFRKCLSRRIPRPVAIVSMSVMSPTISTPFCSIEIIVMLLVSRPTIQMSRAPQRRDGTVGQARRLQRLLGPVQKQRAHRTHAHQAKVRVAAPSVISLLPTGSLGFVA